LFATEKFEGYNGILRNALVHSNRQSPGKDIDITFANFGNLRHLFSGGYFWDAKEETYHTAAPLVPALFSDHPSMQKSMGYNKQLLGGTSEVRPVVQDQRVPTAEQVAVPNGLANYLPDFSWTQVAEIGLTDRDAVRVGSWILVSFMYVNHFK
jgi:hypothetical protein